MCLAGAVLLHVRESLQGTGQQSTKLALWVLKTSVQFYICANQFCFTETTLFSGPQLDQSALGLYVAHTERHGVSKEKIQRCSHEGQTKIKRYFLKNLGLNAARLLSALRGGGRKGREKKRKITIEFSSIKHKSKLCFKVLTDIYEYIIYYDS